MKIVIDGGSWPNSRGFGRFTRGVVHAVAASAAGKHRLVLLLDPAAARRDDLPAGVEVVTVPVDVPPAEAAAAEGSRKVRDLFRFRRAAAAADGDVLFFPAVYSWFPARRSQPIVVTFHDAIAESHPRLVFPTRRGEFFWRLKCRAARRQADAIVTPSESARDAVARVWRVASAAITVVSEGVDRDTFHPRRDASDSARARAAYAIPGEARVLLAVGGLAPHKNLDRLILALEELRRNATGEDIRLILVGGGTGDVFFSVKRDLEDLVRARGLAGAVTFTGFVPDGLLADLYRCADALVFPSLLEGFGLPALEALACGTPVVASDRGALPEVLGDAALFFDPESVEGMAAAIRRTLDDPQVTGERVARGLGRAARYTWESAAQTLLSLFERVARSSRPG